MSLLSFGAFTYRVIAAVEARSSVRIMSGCSTAGLVLWIAAACAILAEGDDLPPLNVGKVLQTVTGTAMCSITMRCLRQRIAQLEHLQDVRYFYSIRMQLCRPC